MTPGVGVLLSDDLLFTSKVQATARAHGGTVRVARTSDSLLSLVHELRPAAVLLDLHNPDLNLSVLVEHLRQACSPLPKLLAYGSHVDTATLKAARQAGLDRVMPRSQFVEVLEAELPVWLGLSST